MSPAATPLSLTDKSRTVARALAVEEFSKSWDILFDFMARSRQSRKEPVSLFALQVDMARELLGVQRSKGDLRIALENEIEDASVRELHRRIAAAERLAYVIKQIADGIAWRSLDYDRGLLHILSAKSQPGALGLRKTLPELRAAEEYVIRTGGLAIMSDLTNILRYGDYVGVRSNEPIDLVEVKSGRRSAKSGRSLRQRKSVRKIVEFFNRGSGWTQEGRTSLFEHKIPIKTHLESVGQLIAEARRNGSSHARLSDCLAVEVWHMEDAVEKERRPRVHNPFQQSREAETFHSLVDFSVFNSLRAPYSIYPFPDRDCFDLMTGAIWLITHFNYGKLQRCFKRRGMLIRWPDQKRLAQLSELGIGEQKRHQDDYGIPVGRPSDPRVLVLGGGEIGRLAYEFLDEESFVDAAEETLDRTTLSDVGSALIPSYSNEPSLWD